MQFRHYLRMIQRGWWIIALAALSAVLLALLSSYVAKPLYRSSARFIVSPTASLSNQLDQLRSLDTLDRRSVISTYTEILNSETLYAQTGTALQLSAKELKQYTLSAVSLPDANVMELTITGPDPATVALLANSMGQRTIDYIKTLLQVYDLRFLDPAVVPTNPISPKPARDTLLALVLGSVLGIVLAILREQLRIPLDTLRRRAMIDSTSTAYSRAYFERQLEAKITTPEARPVSLGLIELTGLQELADIFSPAVQSRMLRHATTIMREELRGADSIGRWTSNTLSVLLPATPEAAAQATLNRIVDKLTEPVSIGFGEEKVRLQPRLGMASSADATTVTSMIADAESALSNAHAGHMTLQPMRSTESA